MIHIPYELGTAVQADRRRKAQHHRLVQTTIAERGNRSISRTSIVARLVRGLTQKAPAVPESATRVSSTVQ
jgi:hypothetical protein